MYLICKMQGACSLRWLLDSPSLDQTLPACAAAKTSQLFWRKACHCQVGPSLTSSRWAQNSYAARSGDERKDDCRLFDPIMKRAGILQMAMLMVVCCDMSVKLMWYRYRGQDLLRSKTGNIESFVVQGCLDPDPKMRMTAAEMLQSPYILGKGSEKKEDKGVGVSEGGSDTVKPEAKAPGKVCLDLQK